MKIQVAVFGGQVPQRAPHLLEGGQAQRALNCHLYSGALRALRQGTIVENLTTASGVKSIAYYGTSWLFWDEDVNIVKTPIAEDAYDRRYVSGSTGGPHYFYSASTITDNEVTMRKLGVPAPTSTPSVGVTGGSAPTESRVYVFTYVTDLGEEGPPSPASAEADENADGTWTVSNMGSTAPTGYSHITKKRLYRSTASGSYQFVKEIAYNVASTEDDGTPAEIIPSLYYTPPPDDLTGFVCLPGGVLAGFTGNNVYFSEPYLPHAWPVSYSESVGSQVVALGVTGDTLVVLTESYPEIIQVPDVSLKSVSRVGQVIPCVNAQGVAPHAMGVIFPSGDGLYTMAANGVPSKLTQGLMDDDDWDDWDATDYKAVIWDNKYFAIKPEGTAAGTYGFILEPSNALATMVDFPIASNAVCADRDNDQLAYTKSAAVSGVDVYNWIGNIDLRRQAEWTSKEFITPVPLNFAAARVTGDFGLGGTDPAEETVQASGGIGALNGTVMNTFPVNGDRWDSVLGRVNTSDSVIFRLYGDDVLRKEAQLDSSEPFPLPAGYTARKWAIVLSTNIKIEKIEVATSLAEVQS